VNGLALCAGGYGLEAGLHIVLPGTYRTVCAVERQAYPVACMVSAMENKALAPFPIWDDVATFDPEPWRGLIHIITAGYPCQPFSLAGKRLGESDPRHIWPHIFRHICALKPALVFCENVSAHLANGFPAVKADLESLGYRVEAGIFSAAEVGAPHVRERLFFLAQLSDPSGGPGSAGAERSRRQEGADACGGGTRPELAHNQGHGRDEWGAESERQQGRLGTTGSGAGLEHSDSSLSHRRPDQQERQAQGGITSCGTGGTELGNAYSAGLEGSGHECAASYGRNKWPWPAGRGAEQYAWEQPRIIKSGLGRATDGLGARNEQLYMLGNGVVPVAAAMAFVALWERINPQSPGIATTQYQGFGY